MSERELKAMTPLPGAATLVGSWLWGMEETRRGLLESVRDLDQSQLDWRGPADADNSIGSLLYHVALVEMSWLYEDLLMAEPPAEIAERFPLEHRTPDGRLAHLQGVPLDEHLDRMAFTRRRFIDEVGPITMSEWNAVREPPDVDYAASPAWIVFHLVEHEAGHLFEIRAIKRRWREASGA